MLKAHNIPHAQWRMLVSMLQASAQANAQLHNQTVCALFCCFKQFFSFYFLSFSKLNAQLAMFLDLQRL